MSDLPFVCMLMQHGQLNIRFRCQIFCKGYGSTIFYSINPSARPMAPIIIMALAIIMPIGNKYGSAGTVFNREPAEPGIISKQKIICMTRHIGAIPGNQFILIHPVAMEDQLKFAIREGGRTVGAGVVASIVE